MRLFVEQYSIVRFSNEMFRESYTIDSDLIDEALLHRSLTQSGDEEAKDDFEFELEDREVEFDLTHGQMELLREIALPYFDTETQLSAEQYKSEQGMSVVGEEGMFGVATNRRDAALALMRACEERETY